MSVATSLVCVLVEAVELAGVPRAEFIERAGLANDARLSDSSQRFELAEFERVQRHAIAMTRDPALWLRLAERVNPAAFDMIGQLVIHAGTLRTAMDQILRFSALMNDDVHLSLREERDTATLQVEYSSEFPLLTRSLSELTMSGFLKVFRQFIGPNATVRAVYFEHAAPDYAQEYRSVFDGKEHFSQQMTAIEFDRAWLDAKQIHQHSRLSSVLEAEAQRALSQLTRGSGFVDKLKQYLAARPAARIPSMETAARDLGMSVRSLRRKLAAEGESYRSIVRTTVEDFASRVLQNPDRSLKDVAIAAGFSDPSAFHRAFKRWTGLSPSEFRRARIGVSEVA